MSSPDFVEPPGPDGSTVGAVPSPGASYRPRWWLHILLFVATFASTTIIGGIVCLTGGLIWLVVPTEMLRLGIWSLLAEPRLYWLGLQFSVPLITILLAHELGHYFAARRHGLTATPPYFIPLPVPFFGIGTLGAVIRVKDPIRNKGQLLDVGAAGPIAGFVALVPFLVYGIAASQVGVAPTESGTHLELGEPLIFQLIKSLVWPSLGENMTVFLHPTGLAAWFGLLVTLLNMLPFAQLDGGHVGYALLGRWHRRLVWPMLGGLFGLGFVWPGWWVWVVIALFLRPQHPPLWDEEVPLDPRRQVIGWAAIAIFILCFVVEPIKIVF